MESVRIGRKRNEGATLHENGEENEKTYKKWTEEEKSKILYCLKVYGHKNVEEMSNALIGRSIEEIRKYLVTVHSNARKKQKNSEKGVKFWLNKCISETKKSSFEKMNVCHQAGQIMKFLSIDGLLEYHPSVKKCEGIDFSAAYRLIHQALMGYPLQPVNQATANFIIESLNELSDSKNHSVIDEFTSFIKNKYKKKEENKCENSDKCKDLNEPEKKQLFYFRKRIRNEAASANELDVPPLKVVLTEDVNTSTNLKCYSLSIGDQKQVSTMFVPVVNEKQPNELEDDASSLWKNIEFNPLEIPDKWRRIDK